MSCPPALCLLQPLRPECAALTPVQRRMDRRGLGRACTHKHTRTPKPEQEQYIELKSSKHMEEDRTDIKHALWNMLHIFKY